MNKKEIEDKVKEALEEIRPFLQNDGGDVSFVSVSDDMIANVRLEGTCAGCNINTITLKMGVEKTIKKNVPQIQGVIDLSQFDSLEE
jgi:Fe-S cluster biogenesis protein NfuA